MASLTDDQVVISLMVEAALTAPFPRESYNFLETADALVTYHETLLVLMAVQLAATPGTAEQAVYDAQEKKVEDVRRMREACGGSGYGSSVIWAR